MAITNPDGSERAFTFDDVLALEEIVHLPQSRIFEARGRKWKITLRTDGAESAEKFFELASLITSPKKRGEKPDVSFILPDKAKTKIEIKNETYLGSLRLLADLAVEPKFNLLEWAAFGHKVGGALMNEIMAWAAEINGLSEEAITADLDDAKNGSGPTN